MPGKAIKKEQQAVNKLVFCFIEYKSLPLTTLERRFMEIAQELLKKINIMPDRFPNSSNSKWIRIYMQSGKTCLGYYNFKDETWREFNDLLNLHNTSTLNTKMIKGWHY